MIATEIPSLRRLVLAAVATAAAFAAVTGHAADTTDFNIPPGELAPALKLLAKQTGLELIFQPGDLKGIRTRGVRGSLSPQDAVAKLIDGTRLTITTDSAGAILIAPVRISASSAPTADASQTRGMTLAQVESSPAIQPSTQTTESENRKNSDASSQTSGDTSGKLEEIVVTAQRRKEVLQDVPISISVLRGKELDRSSYSTVNEVLRTIPGVTSYENSQGAGMAKFAIRGVTSNDSTSNGGATVGYYLDEIPFAFVRFPMSPDVNGYDLERVEVLRGPQGTLYGANALNGVVRVISQDANLEETEFSARTTLSSTDKGGDNYRGDAALSLPIIPGKLAVRAVAGYADYSGWIEQPATGRKDINDLTQKNGRLKVNAQPVENVGIELLAWLTRDDRVSHASSFDNFTTPTIFPETVGSELDAFGLTLDYDASSFSILSSTSYLDFSGRSLLEFPVGLDQLISAYTGRLMSEEVRVNSSGEGPWKWSVGGIYRDEEDSFVQDEVRNTAPFTGMAKNIFISESFAVYGEVSRLFFDSKLELTGGLRYFEDKTSSDEISLIIPGPTPFGRRDEKVDAVTPRVVLSFRPSERATYYASYSEGFRSGFTQNGTVLRASQGLVSVVDPDRLTNYEIGAKGSVLDGRLNYDIAAYYIDWQDAPQALRVPVPGTTNTSVSAVSNSKGIDGYGVDFATALKVSERLQLDATFSWNGLTFVEKVFSATTIPTLVFPEGSRPSSSPKMNAGAGFSYLFPSIAGYSTEFHGSASYTTRMPGAFTNGVQDYGDSLLVARTSVSVTAPAGWGALVFVDNLTNEDGRIRAAVSGPAGVSDRLRPRTVGLQLDYRF